MKRDCAIKIGCLGVGGTPNPDWPVTNYSSEAPDGLEFASALWPVVEMYDPPCLGPSCIPGPTQCTADAQAAFDALAEVYVSSTESQDYANLVAAAQAIGCVVPSAEGSIYQNDGQCGTVYCPDGSRFTYCVPAGITVSPILDDERGPIWKHDANEWAYAQALQQASAIRSCITPSFIGGVPVRAPSVNGSPAWVCLGDSLDDEASTFTISNPGARSFEFSISGGTLPDGTSLVQTDNTHAVITGTPTETGNFSFTLTATSISLPTVTISIDATLVVFGFSSCEIPDGLCDHAYSHQLNISGGTPPYTVTLADGTALPDGLTMDATGLISGTPTGPPETAHLVIVVTDTPAEGATQLSCRCDTQITINGPCIICPPSGLVCNSYDDWVEAIPAGCVFSGTPQDCLSMTPEGHIAGVPFSPGGFTVFATDSDGSTNSKLCTFIYPESGQLPALASDASWVTNGAGLPGSWYGSGGSLTIINEFTNRATCEANSTTASSIGSFKNCGADYDLEISLTADLADNECTHGPFTTHSFATFYLIVGRLGFPDSVIVSGKLGWEVAPPFVWPFSYSGGPFTILIPGGLAIASVSIGGVVYGGGTLVIHASCSGHPPCS